MNAIRPLLSSASIVFAVSCLGIGAAKAEKSDAASAGYSVEKTLPIGGEGRWDYAIVDPQTGLLYMSRQTHTQVIDTKTGKVVADLKDTPGVHGIALAPELNRGFTSNGQGGTVTIFDLKTNEPLGTVPAGQNPDAILYDPFSKKVMAFNGKSKDVSVIDATAKPGAGASEAKIPLSGKPEFAATDAKGHVYVALEDQNSIAEIDSKAMKVTNVWKVEGGEEPSGLAIDPAHHRLFAGCGNHVMAILDSETGKTLGTAPIGEGVDACAFNPETGEAFASCGDGTLTVIKETASGKFEALQTVMTKKGARTMALDTKTQTIYLPTAEFPEGGGKRPSAKPGSFMLVVVAPGAK